ncbi:MAG: hypothetical protein ABWK05_07775 [Pyrobaculum sp.]
MVCVELDKYLAAYATRKYAGLPHLRVVRGDFLALSAEELGGHFDLVVDSPPYVSYEKLDPSTGGMAEEIRILRKA